MWTVSPKRFSALINVALLCGSLVLCFFILEGIAQLQLYFRASLPLQVQRDSTYYLKEVLKPYPDIYRDYFSGPCRARYADYYYLSFDCKSETLNTTSYYWSRKVPDSAPLGTGRTIIWLFGGSTMLNLTASDELTIANQLAKNLNKKRHDYVVVNFGMGGFGSTQEFIKFSDLLRRVEQSELPDLVVFYDGYNDAAQAMTFGAGNLQEDITAKLKFMIEGNYDPLLVYFVSNKIAAHSEFWRINIAPLANRYFERTTINMRPPEDKDYEKAVAVYIRNTKLIRAISSEFGVRPVFVLQPMIFTKKSLTAFEESVLRDVVNINGPHADYMRGFYQSVKNHMVGDSDFIDLTNVLDDRQETDFIDHGHTAPGTGIIIGKALYGALMRKPWGIQ